ncbi:uncharacterized protein [Diadema antillarum]|uniref:uncharacterized protein n=1 Tax=Diadema antillarum TaxID=105358 RepID=UPI003A85BA7C
MEISKPILVGRLVIRRHGRKCSPASSFSQPCRRCCRARQKSSRAALLSSVAYMTAGSSNIHPSCKHVVYMPARHHSSKQTHKVARKAGAMAASSPWSTIYQAVEVASTSVQKNVMERVVSPLLSYRLQATPKLASKHSDVLSNGTVMQNKHDEILPKTSDKQSSENVHVSDRAPAGKEELKEGTIVEFRSSELGAKPVSYWIQMPSFKKITSVSALTELGQSATGMLRRRRKCENATPGISDEQLHSEDSKAGMYPKTEISHTDTMSTNEAAAVNDHTLDASASVHSQEQRHTCKPESYEATSSYSNHMPSAADLVGRLPSVSSTILKRFGVAPSSTSSTSDASVQNTKDHHAAKVENGNSDNLKDGPGNRENKTFLQSVEVLNERNDDHTGSDVAGSTQPPSTASYIYNNYNLKYIQVNLFKSPVSLFRAVGRRKEKPVLPVSPTSIEESSTTFFDSDVPLVEMTEALNGSNTNPTSGKSSAVGNQGAVVAKSRKNAEIADKFKETKAKQRADEEDTTAKKTRPVISKANIDARTRSLAVGLSLANSTSSRVLTLQRLCNHLIQYPESRQVAVQERLIPTLLKLKQRTKDMTLLAQIHQTLAQVGYAPAVSGRGVRILSVDGGGSRGIIAIELLRELERRSGQPIHQLFDYIIGVSSGAVLVYLLSYARASLDTCEELFKTMSVEVFKRNSLLGTSKLFFSHAYYDTDAWMKILRDHMQGVGQSPGIEMSQDPTCPKVAAVATLMNAGVVKNFLFRNYNPPANTSSFYQGSCKYRLCEGLRASSAAPGYFEEYKLDDFVFQDGGVLTNNPSALGIHESKLLWPDTPVQCLVSLGTGRYDPVEEGVESSEYSSLKKKLYQFMISATDTEAVHTTLQDLLPQGSYFRFNPLLSEDFLLDENRPEKIDQLQEEAQEYVSFNELRLMQAAGVLTREKSHLQRATDWLKEKKDMYQ